MTHSKIFKPGMKVRIVSVTNSKKYMGAGRPMERMVGKIYEVEKCEDHDYCEEEDCVSLDEWCWHPADMIRVGEGKKIPEPKPQLFDVEKLDIR